MSYTLHVYGRVAIVTPPRGQQGINVSLMPAIIDVAEVCECPDPLIFYGADVVRVATRLCGQAPVMVIGPRQFDAAKVIKEMEANE